MDGTYIAFVKSVRQKPKTSVWDVVPKSSSLSKAIGQVKWFGRWRKYAFFPEAGTVYYKRSETWVSAEPRRATPEMVKAIVRRALDRWVA